MDDTANGGSTADMNGALAKILSELEEIQAKLSNVGVAVRNLDFNVTALQSAYKNTADQVRLVQRRCENREQLIRDFLAALECSGPPRRDTPACDLPIVQVIGDGKASSNDE
jgi:hypothetical protein